MKIKKITILLGCIVMMLIVLVVIKSSYVRGTEKFQTITPTFRTIERKIMIPGTIVPSKEIDIKSSTSGVLETLYVKTGDAVTKGQAIAKIKFISEPREYQNILRRFQIAEAQHNHSKIKYESDKMLFEKAVIAKEEYDMTLTTYLTTKAEYEAAQKELQFVEGVQTEVSQISGTVFSTDNGIIMELPIKEGGSIMARGSFSEGNSIARIAKLDLLLFKGVVNETYIQEIQPGMPVKIVIGALNNLEVNTKLSLISPQGTYRDGVTKFDIEANVVLPEQKAFLAGFSANAEIILERKENILSLEEKHFTFNNDSIYVDVIEDNKLKRVKIEVGISDGIHAEILSGIDASTRVQVKDSNL